MAILFISILSDHLDGAVARKLECSSQTGYIIDGLADRALNVALMLVALDAAIIWNIVVFVVVVRELALYAVRASQPFWPDALPRTRAYSLVFGGTVRGVLLILCLVAWQLVPATILMITKEVVASLNYVLLAVTLFTLPALDVRPARARRLKFAAGPPRTRR
jgi:phosphatidylglycerophosphate synthase